MKVTIKIWDSLNAEEDDAKSVEFENHSDRPLSTSNVFLVWEVQSFMEKHWADSDYISSMHVNVRTASGELIGFEVFAEQTVNFRAIPRP